MEEYKKKHDFNFINPYYEIKSRYFEVKNEKR